MKEMPIYSIKKAQSDPVSTLGIENISPYPFILTANPPVGQGADCNEKCYPTLTQAPVSGQQWFQLWTNTAWTDAEYDVCNSVSYDNKGNPECNGFVGHFGIKLTPSLTSISNQVDCTVTLSSYSPGKPFTVNIKSGANPPLPVFPKNVTEYLSVPFRGVNLAGGDFDYAFQLPPLENAVYFAQKGANTFRLPFKWEYFQPDLSTAIDFTTGDAKEYLDLVEELTSLEFTVIIDMHNYMRYKNEIIGDKNSSVTVENYAAAWAQIAEQFIDNPRTIFDLMNEPHDMSTELLFNNQIAAKNAVRSLGSTHLILFEGNAYSATSDWFKDYYGTPNAKVFLPVAINDTNYAINTHQYFNNPNGGGNGLTECVPPSNMSTIENLNEFTSYLQKNKMRGIFTEVGAISTNNCVEDIDEFLTYLENNPGTNAKGGYIGWMGWAGGAFDDSYPLSLNKNKNGTESRQMKEAFDLHLTPPVEKIIKFEEAFGKLKNEFISASSLAHDPLVNIKAKLDQIAERRQISEAEYQAIHQEILTVSHSIQKPIESIKLPETITDDNPQISSGTSAALSLDAKPQISSGTSVASSSFLISSMNYLSTDQLHFWSYVGHYVREYSPFTLPWNKERLFTKEEKIIIQEKIVECEEKFKKQALHKAVKAGMFDEPREWIKKALSDINNLLKQNHITDSGFSEITSKLDRVQEKIEHISTESKKLRQEVRKETRREKRAAKYMSIKSASFGHSQQFFPSYTSGLPKGESKNTTATPAMLKMA